MAKKATTPASAESREYFLTYLLPSGYTETELNGFKKEIAEIVTKHQGSIVATEEWGKKKLAYSIKHSGKWHTEGVYMHLVIAVEPAHINELERDVYLNTHLLRHLLVLAEEAGEAPAVEPAKTEEKV